MSDDKDDTFQVRDSDIEWVMADQEDVINCPSQWGDSTAVPGSGIMPGANQTGGYVMTTNSGNTVQFHKPPDPQVQIHDHGLDLGDDADITFGEVSLREKLKVLDQIQERLLILEPDFEKMEHYPALKKAYEQYKLIEKLLQDKE